MQCAEVLEAFQPLVVTSRPLPACPERGLLLRTLFGGICHSDLHLVDDEVDLGNGKVFRIRDSLGERYRGLVMGHEICGEILAVGKQVPSGCPWQSDDMVIVYPLRGCQNCDNCKRGHNQLCENNRGSTTEIGQGEYGGGYGSHVVVPEWESVIALPEGIHPSIGCMLPCSGLTAYNALKKVKSYVDLGCELRNSGRLLVIGVGGVGIWVVMLAKLFFKGQQVKVICADVSQERLDCALHMGANAAVRWERDASAERLVEVTARSESLRVDAVIDFVGRPQTVQAGLGCLHSGGTLVMVGLGGGGLTISPPSLISRSISLQGLRMGSMRALTELLQLLTNHKPDVYPPIEIVSLSEVNNVLDRMRKGTQKGRAVIGHL